MTKRISNTAIKIAAVIQILALTLLASCSAVGVNASANVCHATGDAANPYEEITIDNPDLLNVHLAHAEDIYPVPVGGCPTSQIEVVEGNITICHATSSKTNLYEEITVSVNGLNGHGDHEGDVIPMPAEGCPIAPLVNTADEIAVCHVTDDMENPYEEIMVPSVELNEYLLANPNDVSPVPEDGCPAVLVVPDADEIAVCHVTGDAANPYDIVMVVSADLDAYVLANPNDINPMPSTGCPAYLLEVDNGTVTFCHANDDESKSYEEIVVNVDGLDGHGDHEEDVFPISEADGCPASAVVVNDGRVTICHATGSKKNPYVEITVSVNGLNGHDKHSGDIIPAPADGCKP